MLPRSPPERLRFETGVGPTVVDQDLALALSLKGQVVGSRSIRFSWTHETLVANWFEVRG